MSQSIENMNHEGQTMKLNYRVLPLLATSLMVLANTAGSADAAKLAPTGKDKGVVSRVETSVEHGVDATASGLKRGAKAAAYGIKRGTTAAANGVETAAKATSRFAHRVAHRFDGSSSEPSSAKQ